MNWTPPAPIVSEQKVEPPPAADAFSWDDIFPSKGEAQRPVSDEEVDWDAAFERKPARSQATSDSEDAFSWDEIFDQQKAGRNRNGR